MATGAKTAQIHFLAIDIPVRVRPVMTSENGTTSFKLIHEDCGTQVKQPRYCPHCDKTVEQHELVKGVEVSKGNFVTLSEDEVKSVSAERSPLIELHKFVGPIDPLWVYANHWLDPDTKLPVYEQNYASLAAALRETKLSGFGSAALWGKQRPVIVRAVEEGSLMLSSLHTAPEYSDPTATSSPPDAKTKDFLIGAINQWNAPLEEEDLLMKPDTDLKELIGAKIAGQPYEAPAPTVVPLPTADIQVALKASVELLKTSKKKRVTKKKKVAA